MFHLPKVRPTPTESQSSIPFTHALLHTISTERNKKKGNACMREKESKGQYYPTDDKWPPIGNEEGGILEINRQRCD